MSPHFFINELTSPPGFDWFSARYFCKASVGNRKGSIEAGVMKLISRPGGAVKIAESAGAQREVKVQAANKLHGSHPDRSSVSTEAMRYATKGVLLSTDEFLTWNNDYFAEAAMEIARVLTADDRLILELNTKNEPLSDSRGWSLWMRMSMIEKKVIEFAAWEKTTLGKTSKSTLPNIDDIGKRFTRFQTELNKLDLLMKAYSFGDRYRTLALKYELVGIYNFSKWCQQQKCQQEAFLKHRKSTYSKLCHAFKRHHDTPDVPKSWPVVTSDGTDADAAVAAPAEQ